jgi:hypothetical protein
MLDLKKAARENGKRGQEVRKEKEAPDAYAVPKKRKPGQRKLNADTDDQASALEALAAMGIKDAILPAVSIVVETSNAVLEALDSKCRWAAAREEGVKANEFWTAAVGAAVKAAWPFLGSSAASRAKAEKSAREGLDGTHPGRPG